MHHKKSIFVKNGVLYSNIKNKSIVNYIKSNKQELMKFITSVSSEQIQSLYDSFEERAAIIEHDGGYCKELAEKMALEQIRMLCVTREKQILKEAVNA